MRPTKFAKGTRLAPRNYPLTPGAILRVDGYEETTGCLKAHPERGGFLLTFPPKAVADLGFVDIGDAKPPSRKAHFYFDLGDAEPRKFEGIDRGQRWNGWAVPFLTEKGMKAMAEDLPAELYALTKLDDGTWELFQKDYADEEDGGRTICQPIEIDGETYYSPDGGFTLDVEPIEKPIQDDGFLELISAARMVVNDSYEIDPGTIDNAEPGTVGGNLRRLYLALQSFDHVQV